MLFPPVLQTYIVILRVKIIKKISARSLAILPIFFANFRFSRQFSKFFSEFTGRNIKKLLLARCSRSQYRGITYFNLKFLLKPAILQSLPIEFKVKNSKNFRSLAALARDKEELLIFFSNFRFFHQFNKVSPLNYLPLKKQKFPLARCARSR